MQGTTRTGAAGRGSWLATAVLAGSLATSGCAIGNRGELELSRHISIGQELIDLKRARDEGAIDDEEYARLKAKVMELADSIEVVGVVNDYTPDEAHQHDED